MKNTFPKLYYYTTTATLQAILTNNAFWATNSLYMNDSEEYKNGLREIQRILSPRLASKGEQEFFGEEINQLIEFPTPHSYSISFSTNPDLLSQWSMYAKDSGVNIELDFSLLKPSAYTYHIACNVEENGEKTIALRSQPKSVYYLTESAMLQRNAQLYKKIEKYDDQIVKNLLKSHIIEQKTKAMSGKEKTFTLPDSWEDTLFEVVSRIKRYEFYAEEEWRLIFELSNCLQRDPIFYREQDKVLKPFIKVACSSDDASSTHTVWPITAITVGPGSKQNNVFESLKHFLNYGHFVRMTRTPENDRKVMINYLCKLKTRLQTKRKKEELNLVNDYRNRILNNSSFQVILLQNAGDLKKSLIDIDECNRGIVENTYMSKSGIILLKSEIPYIY